MGTVVEFKKTDKMKTNKKKLVNDTGYTDCLGENILLEDILFEPELHHFYIVMKSEDGIIGLYQQYQGSMCFVGNIAHDKEILQGMYVLEHKDSYRYQNIKTSLVAVDEAMQLEDILDKQKSNLLALYQSDGLDRVDLVYTERLMWNSIQEMQSRLYSADERVELFIEYANAIIFDRKAQI